MTQNEMILNHLKEHESISSMEAYNLYGITRLSGRIYDLRHDGHNIVSKSCKAVNRFGKVVSFDRYYLRDSDEG